MTFHQPSTLAERHFTYGNSSESTTQLLAAGIMGSSNFLSFPERAEAEKVRRISPPESGFYSKEIDFQGLPIKAPEVVADSALQEARRRMQMMLGNVPAIRAALVNSGSELHIIGKDQQTSDLPENRSMRGKETDPGIDFDKRTRGVGGKFASCGEENLLHLPTDRYADRDICVHEFAHTIMEYGLDSNARSKITDQYNKSTSRL